MSMVLNKLRRMNKYDIAVLIIFVFSLSMFSFSHIRTFDSWVTNSPDENQYVFFGQNWADTQKLYYVNELNADYSPEIFAPRQYIQIDEKTLPNKAIGYLILLGTSFLIDDKLFLFMNPIMGAVCLLFYYAAVSTVFGKKVGAIATGLFSVFPSFLFYSNTIIPQSTELAFLMGSIFFLIRMLKYPGKCINYVFFALFFALAIWIRYEAALFFLGFGFVLLFTFSKLNKKYLLSMVLTLLLCLAPLLVYFMTYFGSLSNYESHVMTSPVIQTTSLPSPISAFFPFRSFTLLKEFGIPYLFLLSPIVTVFGIAGIIYSVKSKDAIQKKFLILFVTILLILVILVGGGLFAGWEYNGVFPATGYARYYLPIYALLTAYSAYGIIKCLQGIVIRNAIVFLLLCAYFITSINLAVLSSGSIKDYARVEKYEPYNSFIEKITEVTPSNSVVFCKFYDKLIFPHRSVAYYIALPEETVIEETTNLILQLESNGIPVYFLNEDFYNVGFSSETYFEAFRESGLTVELAPGNIKLYRVTDNGGE